MRPIKTIAPPRADVERCIARYDELPRSEGALFEDMRLPEGKGFVSHVIGTATPEQLLSLAPEDHPSVNLPMNYGVTYAYHGPGTGASLHAHSAYETLIVLSGTWRISWMGSDGLDSEILGVGDTITAPPGLEVAFSNVTAAPGSDVGTIISILGTKRPDIQFAPSVVERMVELGIRPANT